MYGYMTDHVALLHERIEKAKGKVLRHQKSLESAKSELSDLTIALRVLEGLSAAGDSGGSAVPSTIGRQLAIVGILPVGREKGRPPADLYQTYILVGDEDITIDTFRTTIWRMRERIFVVGDSEWGVFGDGGVYWKMPVEEPERVDPREDYVEHWDRNDGDEELPPF